MTSTTEDEENLKSQLLEFPCHFILDIDLSYADWTKIIIKLFNEQKNEPEEYSFCSENLLSFAFWKCKREEKFVELSNCVHKNETRNIVTLANIGHFYLNTADVSNAKKVIQKLQSLKREDEFEKLKCEAKAELAYSLSRCSLKHYETSIELFRVVVVQCPKEYSWKFGLALTIRRLLHFHSASTKHHLDLPQLIEEAKQHLIDICQSDALNNLKGKAWVTMGDLCHTYKNLTFLGVCSSSLDKTCVKECFENGLKTAPEDRYVLERCGRFFRYQKDYKRAELLLQKAIEINETSFAHHHLGLLLYDQVRCTSGKPKKKAMTLTSTEKVPRVLYTAANEKSHFFQPTSSAHSASDDKNCAFVIPKVNQEKQEQNTLIKKVEPQVAKYQDYQHADRFNYRFQRNIGQQKLEGNQNPKLSQKIPKVCLFSCVKNPRNIWISPKNIDPRLFKAEKHLKRATELNTNFPAYYDLGLLYMSLTNYEKAIETFRKIINGQQLKIKPQCIILVNSLEQSGYCLLTLSDQEKDEEKKKIHKENGLMMLRRAIEEMSDVISHFPKMKQAWTSIKTIEDLLTTVKGGFEELGRLNYLLKNYPEAIRFNEMALKCDKNSESAIKTLVQIYLNEKEYMMALTFLKLQICISSKSVLHQTLLLQTYLRVAKGALKNGDLESACHYFLKVFNLHFHVNLDFVNNDEVEEEMCYFDKTFQYEVYVLNIDPELESEEECIASWLQKYCGLRVTHGKKDIFLGENIFTEQIKLMSNSRNIIVLLGPASQSHPQYFVEQAINIISSSDGNRVLCTVILPNGVVSPILKIFGSLPYLVKQEERAAAKSNPEVDEAALWTAKLFDLICTEKSGSISESLEGAHIQ